MEGSYGTFQVQCTEKTCRIFGKLRTYPMLQCSACATALSRVDADRKKGLELCMGCANSWRISCITYKVQRQSQYYPSANYGSKSMSAVLTMTWFGLRKGWRNRLWMKQDGTLVEHRHLLQIFLAQQSALEKLQIRVQLGIDSRVDSRIKCLLPFLGIFFEFKNHPWRFILHKSICVIYARSRTSILS